MMRGKVQQQLRPVCHGTNAAGGLERRALGRNIGPSSSIILLLRCLFVGIVVYSGRLAASAMDTPNQPEQPVHAVASVEDGAPSQALVPYRPVAEIPPHFSAVGLEESSTSEETWCEAVVTPRWRFSLRRVLTTPKKDSLLVGTGFSVFRFGCYFRKNRVSWFGDMKECHQRAVSACDGTKLGRMVFEIDEADRRWLKKKILGFRKSKAEEDLIPIYFFLRCQTPRNVDEEGNGCQGGKESRMHYYNMLFDSYTHARLIVKPAGTVDSDQDQLPAADNEFAGRVLVMWGPGVAAECGKDKPEKDKPEPEPKPEPKPEPNGWSGLLTRNSWPPQFLRGLAMNERQSILDDCTVVQLSPRIKIGYNYQSFDTYRYESNNDTRKHVDGEGTELSIRQYSVPEMFPFRLPDLGEKGDALIVHIKLSDYSPLYNPKTTSMPFKDRKSTITTIKCRAGSVVGSLEKCHAKVKEEIEAANARTFVSSKEPKYLSEFLNLLLPALEEPSKIDTENLRRYRFILEGKDAAELLKGVTPPKPSKDKSPVVLSDDEIPLVTIPFKPVLWPSYSDIDWTVHQIYFAYPVTRYACAGEVSLTFDTTQWDFRRIEKRETKKIDLGTRQQNVLLKVHPARPPNILIGDIERQLAKNQIFTLSKKEVQNGAYNGVSASCANPFGGYDEEIQTIRFTLEYLAIVPIYKIPVRSTIMFHVY